MTEQEQREWVARLGKTPEQQMSAIREILRHARGDKLSAKDAAICVRNLRRLEDERLARRRAWRG